MAVDQLLPVVPEELDASHTNTMEDLKEAVPQSITVVDREDSLLNECEDANKELAEDSSDKAPLLDCSQNNDVDEKNDSTPENPDKMCQPRDCENLRLQVTKFLTPKTTKSRPLQIPLQKIDENEELDTTTDVVGCALSNDLVVAMAAREPTSPTAEEVSRFINDKSAYIEDVFKCMLRGITNSKLSMVKNGFNAPSSITELEEGEDDENEVIVTSSGHDGISPEVKIVKLIQNLDYFIEIVCSIKSSDAKDTYSIIVLYEKLIFDLKAEISSLSKSLKIYRDIVGKKQDATR